MKKDMQILKALITEMQSGDCCTECGGAMYEGMCTECGYMEEKLTYTDEYDDNPKLKGRQSKLPDQLQKAIINKENHEGTDHEVSMANNSIDSILWAANELKKHLQGGERDIPAWIQDHITNAENYIVQAAKNFHEYGDHEEEDLSDMDAADYEEENEMSLQEMVKKVGKKYNVYSKKGKKLGSHPSKKKAQKQMAAIEISKQGK